MVLKAGSQWAWVFGLSDEQATMPDEISSDEQATTPEVNSSDEQATPPDNNCGVDRQLL